MQLKDALNTVWEVEPPPGKGIWGFARTYVLSLAGVLSLGFLLLVSMLMTTALSAVGKYISPYLPESALQIAGTTASFAVISVLFAMMFKWLPDAKVRWRDVWIGAIATAVLFEVGKLAIGLYIGKQGLEFDLGRGGFGCRCADLGVLHFADRIAGRRIHQCLCEGPRLTEEIKLSQKNRYHIHRHDFVSLRIVP